MTWTRLRLAAAVDPRKSEIVLPDADSLVSFLPMQEVGSGRNLTPVETRTLGEVRDGYTYLADGDVAIATISPSFQNGKGGVLSGAVNGVCFATTELTALRPLAGTDPYYLRYALQSEPFIQHGVASLYGVAGQKRVPTSLLKDYRIWLPTPEVQQRLVAFLDRETQRIDESIDRLSHLLVLVDEREFAAIAAAVERVAEGQVRLSLVAALGTGHTPDRTRPEYWEDCTIPWVTAADLSARTNPYEPLMDTAQNVSELGVANSAAVVHEPGTVMLCRTASVGLVCRIGVPMATTQAFVTWTPSPELDSEFLLYCLIAKRDEWDRLKFGSTHDTIYFPDIQSVKIPLADLKAQRSAVAEIREATDFSQKIRRQSEALMELLREKRQALISAAITGHLDVEAMV
jgi:type I restriction enzyme, S subunit